MTDLRYHPSVVALLDEGDNDAFVGGSWLVDARTAKDIDIILPLWDLDHDELEALGFTRMEQDDPKYSTDDLQRIHSVYEHKDDPINVIVIRPVYYAAYLGACATMAQFPEDFQDREQRIELHVRTCKMARDLAIGSLTIPEKYLEL